METGEVFAWLVFLCIISILFFAAFGQTSITEDTIEEYMENIMQKLNVVKSNGPKTKLPCL